MDHDELAHRFEYHPPRDESTRHAHEDVRASCLAVARHFDEVLPAGREKSLVMTHLETAMFWANAAIARQL